MTKRVLPVVLAVVIAVLAVTSCRKYTKSTADETLNYFPLKIGKFITYRVDSTIYDTLNCMQTDKRSQIKYAISDTFRDNKNRLSYLMDVYTRPHEGADWLRSRVILLTPAAIPQQTTTPPPGTPQNTILWTENEAQVMKLVFPIAEGISWMGNTMVDLNNPEFSYLRNWNYKYQQMRLPYNNGEIISDNTVTVIENNETVNYPQLDSNLSAYRIYSKAVYAYQIGPVYQERTYWTYDPYKTNKCVKGYTVVMRAIDHN